MKNRLGQIDSRRVFNLYAKRKKSLDILYSEMQKLKIIRIIIFTLKCILFLNFGFTLQSRQKCYPHLLAFRFNTWAERNMHVFHDKIVSR